MQSRKTALFSIATNLHMPIKDEHYVLYSFDAPIPRPACSNRYRSTPLRRRRSKSSRSTQSNHFLNRNNRHFRRLLPQYYGNTALKHGNRKLCTRQTCGVLCQGFTTLHSVTWTLGWEMTNELPIFTNF